MRIALIGCGQIGQAHLDFYKVQPGVELIACWDRTPEKAREVATRFGIRHVCASVAELVGRDDVDAVDVCLHNNFHATAAIAALTAGKHVYCEKPIAGTYRDGVAMVEAAAAAKRTLHIQLALVFANETRACQELIAAGELGAIYHARSAGHRRRGRPYVDGYGTPAFVQRQLAGGGALLDMGVYHLTQVLHLLGNLQVERISGHTHQHTAMDPARRAVSGYDVEELAVGFVRLAGGVTLEVTESWAMHLDRIEGSFVVGDRGGVKLAPFSFFHRVGELDLGGTADLGDARFRWNTVHGDGDWLGDSHRHWLGALTGKVPLLPTAALALNAALISEGIYRSAELGREVTAAEVIQGSRSAALPLS